MEMEFLFYKIPIYPTINGKLDFNEEILIFINKWQIISIEKSYNDITMQDETVFHTTNNETFYSPLSVSKFLQIINEDVADAYDI